ncbi:unnamed protein product [Amoebophrya sp. A25]|nr:unnamed protein product [Amoebophrya sp. A25]|eukprot:GSA25T00009750001.1
MLTDAIRSGTRAALAARSVRPTVFGHSRFGLTAARTEQSTVLALRNASRNFCKRSAPRRGHTLEGFTARIRDKRSCVTTVGERPTSMGGFPANVRNRCKNEKSSARPLEGGTYVLIRYRGNTLNLELAC